MYLIIWEKDEEAQHIWEAAWVEYWEQKFVKIFLICYCPARAKIINNFNVFDKLRRFWLFFKIWKIIRWRWEKFAS